MNDPVFGMPRETQLQMTRPVLSMYRAPPFSQHTAGSPSENVPLPRIVPAPQSHHFDRCSQPGPSTRTAAWPSENIGCRCVERLRRCSSGESSHRRRNYDRQQHRQHMSQCSAPPCSSGTSPAGPERLTCCRSAASRARRSNEPSGPAPLVDCSGWLCGAVVRLVSLGLDTPTV